MFTLSPTRTSTRMSTDCMLMPTRMRTTLAHSLTPPLTPTAAIMSTAAAIMTADVTATAVHAVALTATATPAHARNCTGTTSSDGRCESVG